MKNYTVVCRPDPESEAMKKKMTEELNAAGYLENDEKPDTVFVIGGDGTFIYAVHYVTRKLGIGLNDVKFYGIHTGTLGFYTDFRSDDYREFIDSFLQGKCYDVSFPLLQVVFNEQKHHAINEIRIENPARTQKIDVYINGEKFERFQGTGMCLCTQLGSTAYNRSLGGAVIQEGLDFLELTEVAGIHHIKSRSLNSPIILKGDTIVEFRSESFKNAVLGCDSDIYPLDDVHSIVVRIALSTRVHTLRAKEVSYFDRLKSLF